MPPPALPPTVPRLVAILSAILVLAACSSAKTTSPETPTFTPPPAVATPLIGAVSAAPIAVPTTDGRTHLAYELVLTNALGGNAVLESLTASAGDRQLITLSGDNLKYWTRTLGSQTPTNVLGPGQTAVVWLDLTIDGGAPVPTEITHSVRLSVAKPVAGLIGSDVTQDIAPVTVSTHKPASVSPPLDGPNWVNANGCCTMTAHRMAANPVNAGLWFPERFAIDYIQLTNDFRLFNGDPTQLASYPYFGTAIHAAGDGKVVSVVDNLPEQVPSRSPSGLPLDQYPGNHIVQDLGDGNYALYAHLKPGSITVKAGDELKSGQSIAALGNSGNSDAPHLHFQVMDGPQPLAANGLPFVIKSFRLDQRIASQAGLDRLFTGQPAELQPGFASRDTTDVSPLVFNVMNYSAGQ
jgi:Peptidase family M23